MIVPFWMHPTPDAPDRERERKSQTTADDKWWYLILVALVMWCLSYVYKDWSKDSHTHVCCWLAVWTGTSVRLYTYRVRACACQKIRKIRIEKGTIMVFCFAFSDAIVIYKPDQLFDTCGRYRGVSKPVRVYGIQAQMLANNNNLFTSHIYFDRIKIHLLNFFYGLKLFTYYWNHMSICT